MWSPRSKGFTLVEVLLGGAIAVVILGVIYQLWAYSRFTSSTAHQGYMLTEGVATSFRSLQRELAETSLSSIVVDKSGVSFVSAREESGLKVGADGAPHWVKAVRYSIRPAEKDPTVGDLLREERPLTPGLPFPEPPTWTDLPGPQARVMAHGLLLAGYKLEPGPNGLLQTQADSHAPGGFVVRFVRREAHLAHQAHGHEQGDTYGESLSELNPASQSDHGHHGWTAGNTGLVQVTLGVLERDGSTGQVGFVELRMRVRPAHD